ncbi:MAG TPA: thiamine pyrophosphate-binding protein [Casimicrobiaceae bacterium]|nr:thiamine pyrophosphate-binding protein [Casimicrobiaceae bacterium]
MSNDTVAAYIAATLKARGVDRVFGLCGGHVMPIWMALDAAGIGIVDVRDERAAVMMAHAYAEIGGGLGVALVTAGPGVTNAMTGIANAHVARASVLVLSGVPPRMQEGKGALQDLAHVEIVRPLVRYARTVREPTLVPPELDEAIARALGHAGEPGPAYLDFPTDTLRAPLPAMHWRDEHMRPKRRPALPPVRDDVARAADLLLEAKRPLILTGRGARRAQAALLRLLDVVPAACLDTGESRGIVPDDHPCAVSAMRGAAMAQADCVVTVGRRLDFQLGYGAPAVFPAARWLRIGDTPGELRDNRRGDVELFADADLALDAIVEHAAARKPAVDRDWVAKLRADHEERARKLHDAMRSAPDDAQGRMHPQRLLACVQDVLPPDAVVVADGGDFLSFARVGLAAASWLDPGSLGCLGVGTPFGIGAQLAAPDRDVAVLTGDGAFGFTAIELDTAARHRVPLLIVVANNGAWQIEVHDQREHHGRVVGTQLQVADYAAMARAFGLHAERVTSSADLPAALARAMTRRPALLDVVVSPEAVSSDARSGLAVVPDLAPLAAWDDAERRWRTAG